VNEATKDKLVRAWHRAQVTSGWQKQEDSLWSGYLDRCLLPALEAEGLVIMETAVVEEIKDIAQKDCLCLQVCRCGLRELIGRTGPTTKLGAINRDFNGKPIESR